MNIYQKLYQLRHPDLAIIYNNIGCVYDDQNKYLKAITYYEKALQVDKTFYGENHPNIALRYINLGLS